MSSIKRFLSDTMIYGFTTIISRMLNFLLTPIFTRNFASGLNGILVQLYSYASFINAILAFGMETTFFRYLQKYEGDKRKVFNASFFITIIATLLFLISAITFANPIAHMLGTNENVDDYEQYILLFAIMLSADAIAVVPFAKLRAENRPIWYGIIKGLNILINIITILLFIYVFPYLQKESSFWNSVLSGWFTEGWLGNVFLANTIASVATLFFLIPQIFSFKFDLEGPLIKSMLTYSFPILIANISYIVNVNLDKTIIPMIIPGERGLQENSIYGNVTKLAVFLNLFVTAFRLGAEPFFFAHSKNENAKKTYANIMEYFVIAMLIVMVGICANLDWLKEFIRGTKEESSIYWSGLHMIPFILFNFVLLGIYMNLSIWYKLSDQTKYGLYISGIGAVMTIILNLILIPKYSYVGSIFSTSCSYILMVSLSYIWGQKNYSIPYPVKKIVLYLIVGTIISWISYKVGFWIGNLIFIAFLAYVGYTEKATLIKIIRK